MPKPRTRVSDADMLVAVAAHYRRHAHQRFRLPDGPVGHALSEAQRLGWVWMPRPGVACITPSGRLAVRAWVRETADAD